MPAPFAEPAFAFGVTVRTGGLEGQLSARQRWSCNQEKEPSYVRRFARGRETQTEQEDHLDDQVWRGEIPGFEWGFAAVTGNKRPDARLTRWGPI